MTKCVELHLAALRGNWEYAKSFEGDLMSKITDKGETALHIAAAAQKVQFVENLVNRMKKMDLKTSNCDTLTYLEAENTNGNTALCYAAATGIVRIAEVMIDAYEEIYYTQNHLKQKEGNLLPNRGQIKPILSAAMLGHGEMVKYLLDKTKIEDWSGKDRVELFITCIGIDLYDVAMKMLSIYPELATAQNNGGEAALHVLARKSSSFVRKSEQVWRTYFDLCARVKNNKNGPSKALKLVKELCICALNNPDAEKADPNPITIIAQSLLIAAEEGNTEFLIELLHFDPGLVWKVDQYKGSMFHIAVRYRQAGVFSLIYELGSIKALIAVDLVSGKNNMLHLAAELAPQNQLNIVAGAAFQMQRELLWFKEVENIVQPSYKEMKNSKGKTPRVLFNEKHKELRRAAEKWMKDTAWSSMVVGALICAVMFITAFNVSGGFANSSWKQIAKNKGEKSFLLFSIFDALALFSSSTSVVMFHSILTSGFADSDFLWSLPVRLIIGVASLFMSVVAMMLAFCATFAVYYHDIWPWPVCAIFGLFSCVPILYASVKYPLLVGLIRSTFGARSMFRSHKCLF